MKMKLVSKETLVLGGLYYVADTPFTLMGAEFITDILLLAFVGCCVMLCFNKTPKFLSAFTAKFPNLSYYLAAFGWVPFFMWASFMLIIGSYSYIQYSEVWLNRLLYGLVYLNFGGIILSLIIAFAKRRFSKKININ